MPQTKFETHTKRIISTISIAGTAKTSRAFYISGREGKDNDILIYRLYHYRWHLSPTLPTKRRSRSLSSWLDCQKHL